MLHAQAPSPGLPVEVTEVSYYMAKELSTRTHFYHPKNGLQLENAEIGYVKASVPDQITQIKLMSDKISAYGAIMGFLN